MLPAAPVIRTIGLSSWLIEHPRFVRKNERAPCRTDPVQHPLGSVCEKTRAPLDHLLPRLRYARQEYGYGPNPQSRAPAQPRSGERDASAAGRSEEHTSELQSLMRISYAVFCLKKKTKQ